MMRIMLALLVVVATMIVICLADDARQGTPDLGPNAGLHGRRVFADDDPWNKDISKEPVDPDSDALIPSIGKSKPLHPDFGSTYHGAPSGIRHAAIASKQPKV